MVCYRGVSGPLFSAGERYVLGNTVRAFCLERLLLCAFTMNHALGPLFLFCCKFLFDMEFLKGPYLSKGFCKFGRKPILIRLPRTNLLFSLSTLLLLLLLSKKLRVDWFCLKICFHFILKNVTKFN